MYLLSVGGEPRSKLFHAIVGLGLAAAGCGGKTQSRNADAGQSGQPDGTSQHDANAQEDALAQEEAATNEPAPDANAELDATAAADVAADVAQETWHPIVIQ